MGVAAAAGLTGGKGICPVTRLIRQVNSVGKHKRVRCLAFGNGRPREAPISMEEHTSMTPAKPEFPRFKNLPPFRHNPGLQISRLRYSLGLAPTTRLNALLNAASDS